MMPEDLGGSSGSREPSPAVSALTGFDPGRSAVLSECGRYRYRLERQCAGDGATLVLMVNPSTADAEKDDATIRKLVGFGNRHRWGRLMVGNLFAYRATDVRELAAAYDPIGPVNDVYLQGMANEADRVICAWGPVSKVPLRLRCRWQVVWGELPMRLATYSIGAPAKCGHPRHPLMLAYSEPLLAWGPPASAMSARQGQDPQGLEAKPASATGAAGDAQTPSEPTP